MSLPRYPEYKDSGVAWLGEVPGHWDVAPLKRNFQIVGGSTPKSDQETYWDGEIVWVTPSDLSKLSSITISDSQRKITSEGLASCGTTLVPSGSIVLSTRAPIGSLAIAETELCTNQGCKSLVPLADTQPRFYGYLLSVSTGELNIRGKGTTFLELSGDELGAFKVGVPPSSEQQTIAAFLDCETGKIDALISEQRRLVELLAEKRQAVISHAVTKGLNPDAKMKDSGIEWLGEVPEHWGVVPIKSVTTLAGRIGFRGYTTADIVEEGQGAITLSPSNMGDGNVLLKKCTFISWEKYYESPEIQLSCGDVIMVKTGSTLGKVALVRDQIPPATINPQLVIFKEIKCSPVFLFFSLYGHRLQAEIEVSNTGGTIPTMTQESISNFALPLPPIEEQSSIAAFLDTETAQFDTLTLEANRAIALLQERRSALISAAVTGKIDVRSYSPALEAT